MGKKCITISEYVYNLLVKMKGEQNHQSFDSVIRQLLYERQFAPRWQTTAQLPAMWSGDRKTLCPSCRQWVGERCRETIVDTARFPNCYLPKNEVAASKEAKQ